MINKVEEAERLLLAAEPDRKLFHLSIINLVIGSQSINQSINQSIFFYYGMTKCRPATRSKNAIQLVRIKACLDDKPKN